MLQGWWCVAPAATFGVGVYVDYWLLDPGASCQQSTEDVPAIVILRYLSFSFVLTALLCLVLLAEQFAAMDVRISRSLLSTYWTLALVLTGAMSPLLGKLYDAVGARMMVAAAGASPCSQRL